MTALFTGYKYMHHAIHLLSDWINTHHAHDAQFSFVAAPIDLAFNNLPTLCVKLFQDDVQQALYKFNIHMHDDCIVFSPLVVMWAEGQTRIAGIDHAIINHCTESLTSFAKLYLVDIKNITLTSGNLTIERAGKPFFTKLGFDIITLNKNAAGVWIGLAELENSLQQAALQIDTLSAPFRIDVREVNTLCFATLRLLSRHQTNGFEQGDHPFRLHG